MPKGFDKLEVTDPILRLLLRVSGLEFAGKTHFALTAPDPIGILNMDRGLEGVVEKFLDGCIATKEIHSTDFRHMPVKTQDDHEARWYKVEETHNTLLNDKAIRTIIWDTDTEAWEMARMAHFGRLTKIKSHHYGEVNAAFRKLIDDGFDAGKNLIMIGRDKKQYVKKSASSEDSAWNGKYEAAGFTELPSIAQVNLRAKIILGDDGNHTPTVTIGKCRQNLPLSGTVFEDEEACFSWVAANVINGTSPEDWE